MKRLIAIFLLLTMLISAFAACEDTLNDVETGESESVTNTPDSSETEPSSESEIESVPEEFKIPELLPADVEVDGIIGDNEYVIMSGYLDRNTTVHGQFYVVERHNDDCDMWASYYINFDNDHVYVAYAERANYGSEMYLDLNPDVKDGRQLTLHLKYTRNSDESEFVGYDIQTVELVDNSAEPGVEISLDELVVDSARSWWDDGMRNVNYVELKLSRKALAKYAGVDNFYELGIRGTTVSIPPIGGGKPVSCYGSKDSLVFPTKMNEEIGYHVVEFKQYYDPSKASDSRFLEEYGQTVLCLGNKTTKAPSIDGKVESGEYGTVYNTRMTDYGTVHNAEGGKWGVEWANYYISYDNDVLYIAAEVKDDEHVPYGTSSKVTNADRLSISLGGMIDTAAPTSIASSLTFILYDGAGNNTKRDFFDIKDTERDVYGDLVNAKRRFAKSSLVKENSVNHDDATGVTTYEVAIILDGLKSSLSHIEKIQLELLTLGVHIGDYNSDGKNAGERYLGITGNTVDSVYASLLTRYHCSVHYGVIGAEKMIPPVIYLGTRSGYEAFKSSRFEVNDDGNKEQLGDAPTDVQLYVGYGREIISPDEKDFVYFELAGYADGRPIERIRDNLYASCTAFKDSKGNVALIYTLDLHAMDPGLAKDIIARITQFTGVKKENIILNVTHCHTAPGLGFSGTGREAYKEKLYSAITTAGVNAIIDLAPCIELYAGEIDMTGLNFVRRYITDKGNLYGVAQGGPDRIIAHESEIDSMTPAARFVRYGAKDVILVNFAAHCDTIGSSAPGAISADYVSSFRRMVEEELDAHFSMQLGATGNVNPLSALPGEFTFPGTTAYGEMLAERVISELDKLPKLEIKGEVKALASTVTVTVNHETDHMLAKANEVWDLYYSGKSAEFNTKCAEYGIKSIYEAMYIRGRARMGKTDTRFVSAVAIGNIVFAAADFEMFDHTGRDIKDRGNEYYDLTFNCPYSNGMIGYIPAEYAFENGGYEVYSCVYVPRTAEEIADEIVRLISELAK